MKIALKIALFVVVAYFLYWVYSLYTAGHKLKETIKGAAIATAKAPPNFLSTLFSIPAWGFDIARGRGLEEANQTFNDTNGEIWK